MTHKFIYLIVALGIAVSSFTVRAEDHSVPYSPDIKSAIDFGHQIVGPLSGGLGKWLGKLNNKEKDTEEYRFFSACIVPSFGDASISSSFSNYCTGIGGVFDQGLCRNEAASEAYFYVRLLGRHVAGCTDFEVYERHQQPGSKLFEIAAQNGYQSPSQIAQSQAMIQNEVARQKRAAEEEYNRRASLSIHTHDDVMQRGTRVCYVDSTGCDNIPCNVDDANPNNNKVRIYFGSEPIWIDSRRLFACK